MQPTRTADRSRLLAWLGWALVLAAAWLAYRPGMSGGFLFDDFVNLDALGRWGPVADAPSFLRYITSGKADPTGRPLALLSFLLDAHTWPADPAPFLRTNLCLHLLNGTLLFLLLRGLGRMLAPADTRGDAAALLGAGLWLLHPLLVSTTLYVVQREAMLPATFVLLGLLGYARGRELFALDARRGMAWMVASIVLGTGLAMLSKANGVLLPLLAWVLEATVLRGHAHPPVGGRAERHLAWIRRGLLLAPSLALFAWLASFLPRWNEPLAMRPWTIGERLLTEGRVLVDYLQLLAVPRSVSTGLFNDDYPLSSGLFDPASTALCWLAVTSALGMAIGLRRRQPALAAGVLFFLAGHVLESTTVPLEPYFEHRNYLPAMLLFWPLARAVCYARYPLRARGAVAVALLALLGMTTWQRAGIWGDPMRQAQLWVAQNPNSSRAQAALAIQQMRGGQGEQALARLAPLWRDRPDDLQIALNYVNAACMVRALTPDEARRLEAALRRAERGISMVRGWLAQAIHVAGAGGCSGLDLASVERWLAAAEDNPAITVADAGGQSMPTLRGLLAVERGQADEALRQFDAALLRNPSPEIVANQVATLASAGWFTQALAHLDAYERLPPAARPRRSGMRWVHDRVLERQGYHEGQFAQLRRDLEAEIAAQGKPQ